jgi:Tfp pilus assembly protein PilX
MLPAHIDRSGAVFERGVALIVGLVILAILSMLGVAAFSISTQQERMAGNSRDRIRAFEAAEAALRDCEEYVQANGATVAFAAPPASGLPSAPAVQGMYLAPASSAAAPVSETQSQAETAFWQNGNLVRQLPLTQTADGTSFPPSCIAEKFTLPNSNWVLGTPLNSTNSANVAHITAHGYGLNPNTVVRLESYYAM